MMKARNGFLLLFLVFCLPVLLIGQSTNNAPASNPAATPTATSGTIPPANPQTPEEFFARARKLSDLEAAGVPFHLKATFVATGDAEYTGNGTYEEWWQSKNVWRKEATLGDYKYVAARSGAKKAASATQAYTPLRVRQVEGLQIFDIAPPKEKKPPKWKITHMNLNGVPLTIIGRQEACDPMDEAMICPNEYSFTNNGLLWGYRDIDLYEKYSNYEPFGNLQFPRSMTMELRGTPLLVVQVSTLKKLTDVGRNRFDPDSIQDLGAKPSLLVKLKNDVPKKGVTPPKLIHSRDPKYPKAERNRIRKELSLSK